jgi:hypothetical protein
VGEILVPNLDIGTLDQFTINGKKVDISQTN